MPELLTDEVAMDGPRARSVLGVDDDAGPDELRRAFRTLALVTHPDRGGDAAAFADAVSAFDALSHQPPRTAPRVALPCAAARVDVYDSPARPRPRRDFADVLRAATARLR